MQRRAFLMGFAGALATGLPALADSGANPTKHIVAELTQQGYGDIKLYRTWLGRVRILAYRNGGTREIVLNPRTGEILRDLWTAANGNQGTVSVLDDVNSPRSGSGGGTKKSSTGGSSGGGGGSDGSDGGSSDGGGSGGGSTGGDSGGGGGGTSGGGSVSVSTEDGASADISVGSDSSRSDKNNDN